jgi:farnesyl-diphosphate farnesyltransferase
MAIATLAKVYNNPLVFTENVKIRKGLAAKLMMETHSMEDVYEYFDQFSREILRKLSSDDPNYNNTKAQLEFIFSTIDEPNILVNNLLLSQEKVTA